MQRCKISLSKWVFWLAVGLMAVPLQAQDPPPDISQTPDPGQQGARIVDGRPTGYFIKRALHPFTWVDVGVFRPAYSVATSPLFERLGQRPGRFRVGIGGAGPGSGFGPSITPLHHAFFGRTIEIETSLLYTYRHYQNYQFSVHVPAGSSYVFVDGAYRSRPEDNFFGIGNDTSLNNESFFKTVTREGAIGFSAQVSNNLRSTVQLSFEKVGVTEPQSGKSAQRVFAASNVPALFTGASMRATSLSIEHNTRDDPHMATHGGQEFVEVSLHEAVGKGDFAYWKYHLEFQRFFPVSRHGKKVIALRGLAETNQEKGGSQVPFFDMPVVGTWETLRGFEDYRFRDKSALSLGLEYRYRIWSAFDWSFFVDTGQVAPEPGDFGWNRFHTGYGARFITRPTRKLLMTLDFAHSNEGWRMYVNFNPTF